MEWFWTLALLTQSAGFAADGCPALPEKLAAIARGTSARVGVSVMHLESGARVSYRGAEAFATQSTYKLPIALAALQKAEQQKWSFAHPIRLTAADVVPGAFANQTRSRYQKGQRDFPLKELVYDAISRSDNTASDALLRFAGGPKAVNAYVAGRGLTGIRVTTPIGKFAPQKNVATPDAMTALLAKLHQGAGISAASRTLVLDAMAKTTTGPGRIRAGVPSGTAVAHKTGSSGTVGRVAPATNDVGIVTLPDGKHLAIAVYIANAPTEAEAERTIAKVARAAWDCWAKR